MPDHKLGVVEGRLAECPESPNCVHSQVEKSDSHYIVPLTLNGGDNGMGHLLKVVKSQPRVRIIENRNDYLYATFTSFLFRFVDDVEFYLDKDNEIIHMRSASRTGYSDFGVNRKRIENIRHLYQKSAADL